MTIEIYANSKTFANDKERTDWETVNKSHFKKPPHYYPAPDNYWEYTIYFINDGLDEQAEWLVTNNPHIDYNKSRQNIENSHLVNPTSNIDEEIEKYIIAYDIPSYSLDVLVAMGCIVDCPEYEEYMEFNFSKNQLQSIKKIHYTNRNPAKAYYSKPFFKSIVDNNGIAQEDYPNCIFTFVVMKIEDSFTLAFKIDLPKALSARPLYYDYSQIPPKKISRGTRRFAQCRLP